MRISIALTLTAALSTSAAITAQQPVSQPFRLEVNYVEVDAIVTDRDGKFVADLGKEDFQILEDGRPQNIAVFSIVDLPFQRISPGQTAESLIESDVTANATAGPGRLYLLVLDDVHTSPLRAGRVKAAARQFVDRHLSADDLVAVVHTGTADAVQDFTSSRPRLMRAIDRFTGRKLRSATLDRLDLYQRNIDLGKARDAIADPQAVHRAQEARAALLIIRRLADSLATVQGRRKALVLVSEGIDYDIHDYITNRDALTVLDAVRDTISAATRANVNIYSIDPRGLTSLGDETIDIQGVPDDPNMRLGPASLRDEVQLSQDSLRILAEETGGFALVNSNDLSAAFERITLENSRYYMLGYYSTNQGRNGGFRTIDVRSNRPGLSIRARKGYVAALPATSSKPTTDRAGSPEVAAALDRALPISGLSLRATAAAVRGQRSTATVAVAVETTGSQLSFAKKGDRFADVIELSVAAVDAEGIVRGRDHSSLTVDLGAEAYTRLTDSGLRLLSTLNLAPGRYQLRIAARDSRSGLLGSVFHDLDVPDFAAGPLSMSSLLLTSARANTVPTVRVDLVKDFLAVLPSTAREFAVDDELIVFAEIYDQATAPHRVDVTATVTAADGRVVFQHRQESMAGGRDAGGFGYIARVRLNDLTPGVYVVRIDATSRLSDGGRASRAVQIRVR